jgi:intraflagellar transport protein 122
MQDAVYCIAYASDGSRFASGGADNTVIIWSSTGKGLLKYTHASTIQALAYNPVTQQLASASESDFGLWSPELRSVPKTAVTARIRCLAWTDDGQQLAVGLEDGRVMIRDKTGEQRAEFSRGSMPVWSLAFSAPLSESSLALLAVASWDGTLSFYNVRTPAAATYAVVLR